MKLVQQHRSNFKKFSQVTFVVVFFIILNSCCLCASPNGSGGGASYTSIKVLGIERDIKVVKEIGGAVWVGTDQGLWRITEGGKAKKLIDINGEQVYEIKELCNNVWVRTARADFPGWPSGLWFIAKDCTAQKILDAKIIFMLKELEGAVWVSTDQGLWRVARDLVPEKIIDKEYVNKLKELHNVVWVGTSAGLWRIAKNEMPKKLLKGFSVNDIKEIHKVILISTKSGLWRIARDGTPQKVFDREAVDQVKELNDVIWVTTRSDPCGKAAISKKPGLWCILNNKNAKKIIDKEYVLELKEFHNSVWVRTNQGLWRIKKGGKAEKIINGEFVYDIQEIQNAIWVRTKKGLWRMANGGKPKKIFDGDDVRVHACKASYNAVWIVLGRYEIDRFKRMEETHEELWRFAKGKRPKKILKAYNINMLEKDNHVWISTDSGLWYLNQNGDIEKLIEGIVYRIYTVDEMLWVLTHSGLWCVSKNKKTKKVIEGYIQAIKEKLEIQKIQGAVWVHGKFSDSVSSFSRLKAIEGLWRITRDGKIDKITEGHIVKLIQIQNAVWVVMPHEVFKVYPFKVTITTKHAGQIASLLEAALPGFWIGGDRILSIKLINPQNGQLIHDFNQSSAFRPDSYWSVKGEDKRAYPTARLDVNAFFGHKSIIYDIKDEWHNHFQNGHNGLKGFVLPGPWVWSLLILVFWIVIFFFLLIISPWWLFAHNLLMNPFVRKIGYFGLFPFIVTSAPKFRGHVMRRYRRQLKEELEGSSFLEHYVDLSGDLEPRQFVQAYARPLILLIRGPSGVGKTAFLYRIAQIVLKTPRWTPIIISLASYQNDSLEGAFCSELQRIGLITDKELASVFLSQGGFLLLLDGLNEVGEDKIPSIFSKTRSLSGANAIFFTSQEKHRLLKNNLEIPMAGFKEEEIKKFLEKHLGGDKGTAVFNSITPQTLPMLSNPQNLTTFVQIQKQGKTWCGSTEVALYQAFFEIIWGQWQHPGAEDDRVNLLKIAEDSLRHRQPKFSVDELTRDARADLFLYRILVPRGEYWAFAHDRIRAYLVAMSLTSKWRQETFEELDSNWLVPLKMLSELFKREEDARDLCIRVLKRRTEMAEDLFSHIKKQKPELIESWNEDFYSRLGKRRIAEIGNG